MEPIAGIDVLWITAGLGCDEDSIAMAAATCRHGDKAGQRGELEYVQYAVPPYQDARQ
jgi:hypothetical protein